jgi:MFS family permease
MASLNLSPTVRGLVTLYTSTLLAGMWAMIVPAIPVLAVAFEISPGTAAQIVTASGLGRFIGLPIGGAVLDRLGARSALIAGPAWLICWRPPQPFRNHLLVWIVESVCYGSEMAGIDMARRINAAESSGFHGATCKVVLVRCRHTDGKCRV